MDLLDQSAALRLINNALPLKRYFSIQRRSDVTWGAIIFPGARRRSPLLHPRAPWQRLQAGRRRLDLNQTRVSLETYWFGGDTSTQQLLRASWQIKVFLYLPLKKSAERSDLEGSLKSTPSARSARSDGIKDARSMSTETWHARSSTVERCRPHPGSSPPACACSPSSSHTCATLHCFLLMRLSCKRPATCRAAAVDALRWTVAGKGASRSRSRAFYLSRRGTATPSERHPAGTTRWAPRR